MAQVSQKKFSMFNLKSSIWFVISNLIGPSLLSFVHPLLLQVLIMMRKMVSIQVISIATHKMASTASEHLLKLMLIKPRSSEKVEK